jgi:hypothetical protein
MSVVKATPIALPSQSETLQASKSLEDLPMLSGPAVTPG